MAPMVIPAASLSRNCRGGDGGRSSPAATRRFSPRLGGGNAIRAARCQCRQSRLARPGIGRVGSGDQLRRAVRPDRRADHRRRPARRDPLPRCCGRNRSKPGQLCRLWRASPRGGRHRPSGDGILWRSRRFAYHRGDRRLARGGQIVDRLWPQQLAADRRDARGQVSRERRGGRRIVFSNGQLELRDGAAPIVDWTFPAPFGSQKAVAEFTMADTVTDRASHRGARNRIIYEPLGRRRARRPGNPSASG